MRVFASVPEECFMPVRRAIQALAVLSALLPFALVGAAADAQDRRLGPRIDDVLQETQRALLSVAEYPAVKLHLPALESVTLEMNGTFDASGELRLNLFFASAGGGRSTSESSQLILTFKPPAPPPTGAEIASTNLSDQLADMILAAASGVARAGEREPPLRTSGLTLSLAFAVTLEGGAGAEFAIAPVGIRLGGDVSSTEVQKIILRFAEAPSAQ